MKQDLGAAAERYPQVGVRLLAEIEVRQIPAAISDGKIELSPASPNGDAALSADEKSLLQAGFTSANRDDIEVYYLTSTSRNGNFTLGSAFPSDFYRNMTTVDLNDSLIIPNHANFYSLAHEMYHVISQKSNHSLDPRNLMFGAAPQVLVKSDSAVTDMKRLTTAQE